MPLNSLINPSQNYALLYVLARHDRTLQHSVDVFANETFCPTQPRQPYAFSNKGFYFKSVFFSATLWLEQQHTNDGNYNLS